MEFEILSPDVGLSIDLFKEWSGNFDLTPPQSNAEMIIKSFFDDLRTNELFALNIEKANEFQVHSSQGDIEPIIYHSFKIHLNLKDYYLINNIQLFEKAASQQILLLNGIPFRDYLRLINLLFENPFSKDYETADLFNTLSKKELISKSIDSKSLCLLGVGVSNRVVVEFEVSDFLIKFLLSQFEIQSTSDRDNEVELDNNAATSLSFSEMNIIKANNYILGFLREFFDKMIIYGQYVHSVVSSAFSLPLINLCDFYYTLIQQRPAVDLLSSNNYLEKYISLNEKQFAFYLISLILSATAKYQARQYIASAETTSKVQTLLLSNPHIIQKLNELVSAEVLLTNAEGSNEPIPIKGLLKGYSLNSQDLPYYLCKLEIVKALILLDYGDNVMYLKSLSNACKIYFNSDLTCLKKKSIISKSADTNKSKYYFNLFLSSYSTQIIEILIILLRDTNDLVVMASLKILEYLIVNSPISIEKIDEIYSSLLSFLVVIIREEKESKSIGVDVDQFQNLTQTLIRLASPRESLVSQDAQISNSNYMPSLIIKQLNLTLDSFNGSLSFYSKEQLSNAFKKAMKYLHLILFHFDCISKVSQLMVLKSIKLMLLHLDTTKFNDIEEIQFTNLCASIFQITIKKTPTKSVLDIYNEIVSSLTKGLVDNQVLAISKGNSMKPCFFRVSEVFEQRRQLAISIFWEKNSDENADIAFEILNCLKRIDIHYLSTVAKTIINCVLIQKSRPDYDTILYLSMSLIETYMYNTSNNPNINTSVYRHSSLGNFNYTNLFPFLKSLQDVIQILFQINQESMPVLNQILLFDQTMTLMKKIVSYFNYGIGVCGIQLGVSNLLAEQFKTLASELKSSTLTPHIYYYLITTLDIVRLSESSKEILPFLDEIAQKVINDFLFNYSDELMSTLILIIDVYQEELPTKLFILLLNSLISKFSFKSSEISLLNRKFFALIISKESFLRIIYEKLKDTTTSYFLDSSNSVKDEWGQISAVNEILDSIEIVIRLFEYSASLFEKLTDTTNDTLKEKSAKAELIQRLFHLLLDSENLSSTINKISYPYIDQIIQLKLISFYKQITKMSIYALRSVTLGGDLETERKNNCSIFSLAITNIAQYLQYIETLCSNKTLITEIFTALKQVLDEVNCLFKLTTQNKTYISFISITPQATELFSKFIDDTDSLENPISFKLSLSAVHAYINSLIYKCSVASQHLRSDFIIKQTLSIYDELFDKSNLLREFQTAQSCIKSLLIYLLESSEDEYINFGLKLLCNLAENEGDIINLLKSTFTSQILKLLENSKLLLRINIDKLEKLISLLKINIDSSCFSSQAVFKVDPTLKLFTQRKATASSGLLEMIYLYDVTRLQIPTICKVGKPEEKVKRKDDFSSFQRYICDELDLETKCIYASEQGKNNDQQDNILSK